MRSLISFLFLISTCYNFAQENNELTPEERAYLYHAVKKSPILDENFGRYFDYKGPVIKLTTVELNYDSIETLIVNNPELLIIRTREIAKSSKGLVAEVANKMALWELNKALHAFRENTDNKSIFEENYTQFQSYLLEKLPPNALRQKEGGNEPHPKLNVVMNPTLSFDDKMAHLESMRFLDLNEQKLTVEAIDYAINEYVNKRTREIFYALGGQADEFSNILVAAGDGSITSGTQEDREKDERGKWNQGLPKSVGLFPYQVEIQRTEEKKSITEKLEPMSYSVNNFKTADSNRLTNVHLDVWGYNSENQITVVIEKNGLNYHLFNSGDTRFLSPDSSFTGGKTFKAIINELEFDKIANLNEMIYGRRGFDYWIDYNKKKKDDTELKIEKREKEYSDLGFTKIITDEKPSRKVKKAKRRAIKNRTGEFDGTPTTHSNKNARMDLQQEIVYLYDLFEGYKRKIAELEKQKEEAIDLIARYQRTLDMYKQMMGMNWAKYSEENGIYTFQDSSTFNIATQDFQFKPTKEKEDFEIRLIGVPETSLSKSVDEVMLHINVMDAKPHYDSRINLKLEDLFVQDKWEFSAPLFTTDDSVALRVFFESLLDKKTAFSIKACGQGIGKWDGTRTVKALNPIELQKYPGNPAETRMDSNFVRLRLSEIMVHIGNEIVMEVNSYSDPVIPSITISNEKILNAINKYGISKNEILSAYRTAAIMRSLKIELNQYADKYLSKDQAKLVKSRFNKIYGKTKIKVRGVSFSVEDLK